MGKAGFEEYERRKGRKQERKGAFQRGLGRTLKIALPILAGVLILLAFVLMWMNRTWSGLSMDELVYTITNPTGGTDQGLIMKLILTAILPSLIVIALFIILYLRFKKDHRARNALIVTGLVAPLLLATSVSVYTFNKLDVYAYIKGKNTESNFIDNHYVDPKTTAITFPEKKRNLIYIFLESMETTYADKESGGSFKKSLIPNLTALEQEGEDFSGSDSKLDGQHIVTGGGWTMGAIFSQTAGLPLKTSIDGNAMGTQDSFFPSTVTLGDILADNGYQQYFLLGSDISFAGRNLYFSEHGDYQLHDYNYAKQQGWIDDDYKVFWGYEDEKLFSFAKEELTQIAKSDEPFNYTMLTVDTHFPEGYKCELCGDEFDEQYANVYACSDKQVTDFVHWIMQQDFYENTTIVLCGDHPTMNAEFGTSGDKNYERRTYTNFINSAVKPADDATRDYTAHDMLPTTLAALGAKIDGDRLALGTNLFAGSSKSTLIERYGDGLNQGIIGKSKLMEQMAQIDESKAPKETLELK